MTDDPRWVQIRPLYRKGVSDRKIARTTGVKRTTVQNIIKRFANEDDDTTRALAKASEKAPSSPSMTFERDGSTGSIDAKRARRILTIDQLLDSGEVDREKWIVERELLNKWEVGAKDSDGNIVVEPLFQVKAWLKPRVVEKTQFPTITPVTVTYPGLDLPEPIVRETGSQKVLYIPDLQAGFIRHVVKGFVTYEPIHDRRCWSIYLQIAQRLKPDKIVILGDILDLSEFSTKFIVSPEFFETVQPAIAETVFYLGRLRAICPTAEIVLIEGNHEERLERCLKMHFRAAYGLKAGDAEEDDAPLLSIRTLLCLDDLNIRYVGGYPHGREWMNSNLAAEHGDKVDARSGGTVGKYLNEARYSVMFGHVHRVEQATKTVHYGNGRVGVYAAYSCGSGCRVDDGKVPAARGRNNWQNGFAESDVEVDGDESFETNLYTIVDGRVRYRGEMIQGVDDAEKIADAIGWNLVPWDYWLDRAA